MHSNVSSEDEDKPQRAKSFSAQVRLDSLGRFTSRMIDEIKEKCQPSADAQGCQDSMPASYVLLAFWSLF